MKICMLSELFYPYMLGGAERRYYEIAKRLAKRHDVTVYSLRLHGQKDKERKDGIEIRRIGIRHPTNRRSILPLSSFMPAIFKSVCGDYDIIDANQGIASISGFFRHLTSKPIVATFHDIYWNEWKKYFRFPVSAAGKAMELFWSKGYFDRIIANSPETKRKLETIGFRNTIDVIVSGIDTDFIEKIKAEKEKMHIVYAGRLVKYKNIDRLIRCAAELKKEFPEMKLTIVGSGPEENQLKHLSKTLGVNARFTGFVSETEKFRILKSAEIFVNPSSVEGLGLILIEAMACRAAVVANNLDCYFFCSEENSVLYNNEKGLYSALRTLLHNKRKMSKIAGIGHKTASGYSWDKTAGEVEKVYKDVLR